MAPHTLTVYTIYQRPLDFPFAEFVVRGYAITGGQPRPSGHIWVADTLEQARELVPPEADTRFPRSPDDDPRIIETWM